MPGHHTDKQKRQAQHIQESYRSRGASRDTAERIAWATVNKQKSDRCAKCGDMMYKNHMCKGGNMAGVDQDKMNEIFGDKDSDSDSDSVSKGGNMLDDLFKSELAEWDQILAKSGGTTHGQHKDNKGGGHHKGPKSGQNSATPTRTNHGVPRTTTVPHNYAKGDDMSSDDMGAQDSGSPDDASSPDAGSPDDMSSPDGKAVKKSGTWDNPVVYAATPLIYWVDSGMDAALAKSLEDQIQRKNQDLTARALIQKPVDNGKDPVRGVRNERGQ